MPPRTELDRPGRSPVRPVIAGRRDGRSWSRGIGAGGYGITVVARVPSPVLAPFVEWIAYYHVPSPGWRELILPTGTMALAVSLVDNLARRPEREVPPTVHGGSGAVLLGPGAGQVVADGAESRTTALVSFRPAGSYPFFAGAASAIDESVVELEALWGPGGANLRERLLEAATPREALSMLESVLLARVARPLVADPAITAAAAMLGRGMAVADVADRLGWTDRTLLRRFREQAGLPPKRFARIRRLQRLLAAIPADGEVDWARAAFECGYFDQAHMINDFGVLTGLTPGAYRPQAGCRNHHLPPAPAPRTYGRGDAPSSGHPDLRRRPVTQGMNSERAARHVTASAA